jgi:outer membrane receptor protein involved in Fe transport
MKRVRRTIIKHGKSSYHARRAAVLAVSATVVSAWLPKLEAVPASMIKQVLKGRVESDFGPLADVEVRLLELHRATHTNTQGSFAFEGVPTGHYTLGVHLKGFASSHRTIAVPPADDLVIKINSDVRFEEEISVTAAPWAIEALETPLNVSLVGAEEIARENVASLGDALDGLPGVANIPTGEALGTPVIRGLSENRIRVLNDGVPLNHQQFSWRHSPNVDPASTQRIELVRGPLSVLYGPDAIGGVVNVLQPSLPTAHGSAPVVQGTLASGYGGNTEEWTGRGDISGAVEGFGWRVTGSRRSGGNIKTARGRLDNTDFVQNNGSIALGHTGSWGRGRVRWHHWEDATGFYRPEGFRLDLNDDLFAADLFVPTRIGALELVAGHQINVRKAFPASLQGRAAVNLKQRTTSVRLGLRHRPVGRVRGNVAMELTRVDNTPRALKTLLPEYKSDAAAFMAYEELRLLTSNDKDFDRLILSLGGRWDWQSLKIPQDPTRDLPDGFDQDYTAFTGSLGAVLRVTPELSLAAAMGRGWRPPNAFELFANGIHNGVSAVQIGNPALGEESNLSEELSVRYRGSRFLVNLTAYHNGIDERIYLADTGTERETDEGVLPVFVYRQADARIDGIEASVDAAPLAWLNLGLSYSWIETENKSTGALLPQTPADRLDARIRVTRARLGKLRDPHVGLDLVTAGKGEVSGPDEPFGTPTDSYTLLHGHAGFSVALGKTSLGIELTARNLLDREYTDFLYSYKKFACNPGRDVRIVTTLSF